MQNIVLSIPAAFFEAAVEQAAKAEMSLPDWIRRAMHRAAVVEHEIEDLGPRLRDGLDKLAGNDN